MGLVQELGIRNQLLLGRQLAAEKLLLLGELPGKSCLKSGEASPCASRRARQQTRYSTHNTLHTILLHACGRPPSGDLAASKGSEQRQVPGQQVDREYGEPEG